MAFPDWTGALERAQAHAPFLSNAMERLPDLVPLLAAGEGAAALAWAKAAGADAPDVAIALRRERLALALALAVGDLAGAFPLARVTAELSAFADRAMDAAIGHAIRRYLPDAEPAGFIVLALGKHGAGELNYSSDIDPILLYDPVLLPRRSRDDPGEAAQRVARLLVETLSAMTDEGYVFRVDLRLRPQSEVSPLAIPIEAALAHYESAGLAWERAAFIRARACAGDIAAGNAFLAAIRPFVWRKSLDFGAIREIARLTAQIRANHASVQRPGPGFDIKRGRGGIREIEFFAQTHQLIHGGRNPALRLRGTRASLDALAAAGIVAGDDAQLLGTRYERLREIEHRLQMVEDRQTHSLPKDPAALDAVARLDSLENGAALTAELVEITEAVGSRYDLLIAADSSAAIVPAMPTSGHTLSAELARLGFADPQHLAQRITGWTSGSLRALRSDAALAAFAAIQPQLLGALAAAPAPDRAMVRWEQMLTNLPSAINLFRLLEARPGLLELLVRVLSLAEPLADELARRGDLLDPLIDASALDLPGDVTDLVRDMADGETGDDYERILDRVRRKVGEGRFMLGVQLVEAARDPLDIAAALARIAEAAILVLTDATIADFERSHGRIAGSELVILGLGRIGGGALTHASDLDLVFLFTGEPGGESDGARPLSTSLYFNRLAQRVSAALSVPTAEGALYEVDTRLRPSGEQGPLAVSFGSFALYQQRDAWTWEHLALCRARVLYGSKAARNELVRIVSEALLQRRNAGKLHSDVREMRAKIAGHKAPKGPLDVKLARGGLVDLEFLTHFLQLRDGAGIPGALTPFLGDALDVLDKAGLLPMELGEAHDVLTRMLVSMRLLATGSEQPSPPARLALAKACGSGDWEALLAKLAGARGTVAAAWHDIFGETLEI
ncbi:MAG: bifunctional [glutamine synthetase] adenylyltransferase/[glutamine synthetase]-adenylyl-L-tyrosine phosphorylase [Novosphingobium sp.]